MVQVATCTCFWLCIISQLISQPGGEVRFQTHQISKNWLLEYDFVGHRRNAGEMDLRCAGLYWVNSNDSTGQLSVPWLMHQQINASGVRVVAMVIVILCDFCGDGHNTDGCNGWPSGHPQ